MSLAISTKALISKFANLAQLLATKRNELQLSQLWAKPPNNWSVLIGLLIEYFNIKRGEGKKKAISASREQNDKRPGRRWQDVSPGLHPVHQLIQYQQKRNTRCLSLVTRAGRWIVPLKNTFAVCLPPCWRGSCALHSDTDTATLKGGWVACLSKFKCLDSKRKQEKRDVKVRPNLNTGLRNASLPGLAGVGNSQGSSVTHSDFNCFSLKVLIRIKKKSILC